MIRSVGLFRAISFVIAKIAYFDNLYSEKYLIVSSVLHLKKKSNDVSLLNINFYTLFIWLAVIG